MIPRDILKITPESEIKRQEAIHELIYTEEDYVRDLNLLDDVSGLTLWLGTSCDTMRYLTDRFGFSLYSYLLSLWPQPSALNLIAGLDSAKQSSRTTWLFLVFIVIYTRIFGIIKAHVKHKGMALSAGWVISFYAMSLDSKQLISNMVPMWCWRITK